MYTFHKKIFARVFLSPEASEQGTSFEKDHLERKKTLPTFDASAMMQKLEDIN